MRRLFKMLCIIMVLGSLANAQSPSFFFETCGSGGVSFNTAPAYFRDYWEAGFSVGSGVGVGIFLPKTNTAFSLMPRLDFYSFGLNGPKLVRNIDDPTVVSVSGGGTSNLRTDIFAKSVVSPYVNFGIGFFHISVGNLKVYDIYGAEYYGEGSSDNAFSFMLGSGITVGSPIGIFVGADYILGFTEGESTQFFPIRLGLNYKK